MIKNVLIGIGGTGSRVIESVIHLCAAGLGPDRLHLFMIEPDEGNGNFTRTKSLLKQYADFRKAFQRTEGNTAFKTDIVISPDGEPISWGIFDERDYTLSQYINYDNLKQSNPDIADLANILFTAKELTTPLNEGFRGHPSIGAVVMADPPMEKYPFQLLWDAIDTLSENELRVFIVGSIFGGTGAAGFPTLGSPQLIKYNERMRAKLEGDKSRVLLGGALVLPYFSFPMDNTVPADGSLFVTPADFPIATKAALQYYDGKKLGFDQYYFIGDSLAQVVGKFSTGSSTQLNKPHYLEIVTALAGFDFFAQTNADAQNGEKKYFISAREKDLIDWNVFPVSRYNDRSDQLRSEFKTAIADFTIFAYTYLTHGKNELNRSHKDVSIETWYVENFVKNYKAESALYNPRHADHTNLYSLADSFLTDFLVWVGSMDDEKVALIDSRKLMKHIDPDQKPVLIQPKENINNIGEFIKNAPKNKSFNTFLNDCLKNAIFKDNIDAGSKYLNIFYNAAVRFNR